MELTVNGNFCLLAENGKRVTANFRLVSANGKGKLKLFSYIGKQ
jgi:hypothetical protein